MKNGSQYILIDLYGVIIEESKGYFIPYTYEHFAESEYERITKAFREEKIFSKAQIGVLSSNEFLEYLGYDDPFAAMKDYLSNYLTLDVGFETFAEKVGSEYKLVLLSNDVSEWSEYLTDIHGINKSEIFELTLSRLGCRAEDCVFIDNSVNNLQVAASLGIKPILFNRDGVTYDGTVVNNFLELESVLKS